MTCNSQAKHRVHICVLEEYSVHPGGRSPRWAKAMYSMQCIRHVFKQNNRCSPSLPIDILAPLIPTDGVQSPILLLTVPTDLGQGPCALFGLALRPTPFRRSEPRTLQGSYIGCHSRWYRGMERVATGQYGGIRNAVRSHLCNKDETYRFKRARVLRQFLVPHRYKRHPEPSACPGESGCE
jgi:hypothetical protein